MVPQFGIADLLAWVAWQARRLANCHQGVSLSDGWSFGQVDDRLRPWFPKREANIELGLPEAGSPGR